LGELIRKIGGDPRDLRDPRDSGDFDMTPMPGGASSRKFFRVRLGDGRGSAVAMFVPDGSVPEEIQRSAAVTRRWPFLEVRDLLAERGIRVPALLGEATEHGWLLVEDLGDDTIANYLLRRGEEKRTIYQAAVRDLARAQRELASLPESSIVRTRTFDADLLLWELDHFREWAVEARGFGLSPDDRAQFDAIAGRLSRRIADWRKGFVHRDYQSRNLMVVEGRGGSPELAWIDFQDALLGPRVYDLVALLSDSYQEFEPSFIAQRLDEYAEHAGLSAAGRAEVGREFDLVTVQRKLKDAGRFVFIDRTKRNPSFLGFVEPTIQKARQAMTRLEGEEDMRTLGSLLDRVFAS
jgi:aminoglycoside/choline kinase family phosphotransferase